MKKQQNTATENIVTDVRSAVKTALPKGIKVTVHIPENLNETSRRQKINRIYDILKPELSR